MNVLLGTAAILGGLAMVVVVLTIYNSVRHIEEQQDAILSKLAELARRPEED